MPYLIDGHNLIPFIPGISLQDVNDEAALIQVLQKFAAQHSTRVEVFFDQAPAGGAGSRSFGKVKAHFVRRSLTADQALVQRLSRMGKEAKNWTVVTSDREILVEARSRHSQTLKSAEFAVLLRGVHPAGGDAPGKHQEPEISSGDVDYWLDQFKNGEP